MCNPSHLSSSLSLLKDLIESPSFSRNEDPTAKILISFFEKRGMNPLRQANNVWVSHPQSSPNKPTLLLNSHHDTVKPGEGWQRNPFEATMEEDRLYGLGSNDAGGPLVALIGAFLHFWDQDSLPFNLILAATAEEEISGSQGIASILPTLGPIEMGIVGEPTLLQMAVAEKGLMVLDCIARGRTGHAARNEGINAIYQAMKDIDWFRSYSFPLESPWLGPVKMSVTQVRAGKQHNVVPDHCEFVVDVRTTECYSNSATLAIICDHVSCDVKARSLRLNPSGIPMDHSLVLAGKKMGLEAFGSPTLSDQALLPFPTLKLGPGDSARSHTPDEYICISEIEQGIDTYIKLLEGLSLS
ncbi:MAG: M20 family metallo-hydrolase [Bacteroidota bacterium]